MADIKLAHKFLSKDFEKVYGDERWHFIIVHPFLSFYYLLCKIKWFFQRANKGWADCDTWNMDVYLAKIIGEMSNRFAYKEFSPDRELIRTRDVVLFNALNEIAYGFHVYSGYPTKIGCVAQMPEETEEALEYFKEYFTSLHIN